MAIHDILVNAITHLPLIEKFSAGDLFDIPDLIVQSFFKKKEEGLHLYPNIDSSLKDRHIMF